MKKKRCKVTGVLLVLIVLTVFSGGITTPLFAEADLPPLTELKTFIWEFIESTGFPLTLIRISPVAPVENYNLSVFLKYIVDSTAVLNVDNGVLREVVLLRETLRTEEVSMEQLEVYKKDVVAHFLNVGDWVIDIEWLSHTGLHFSTLAIVASDGTPKYEPAIYFASPLSETLETTRSSESGSTTWILRVKDIKENLFTIDVVTTDTKVIVRTDDECRISDQSTLITFSTAPLWEAKATRTEEQIACGECSVHPGHSIDGKKVIITITWASGFKKVKGEVGANGFSVGVEVEGSLGANGQQQFELVLCANGTATVDGKLVE